METLSPRLKWSGSNPRISESSEAPVFAGPAGPATCYSPTTDVTAMLQRRSGTGSRSPDGAPAPDPAPRRGFPPPGTASNEAGILLMHKDLQKYVGAAAVIGPAGASDAWLLAPNFCRCDERSRNILDGHGVDNLTRVRGLLTEGLFCFGELTAGLGAVYVNIPGVYVNGHCVYVNDPRSRPASNRGYRRTKPESN
jgi:hypothetical protein